MCIRISSHTINIKKQRCAKAINGGNGGLFSRLLHILTELKGKAISVRGREGP
jgi:hypothetical protein